MQRQLGVEGHLPIYDGAGHTGLVPSDFVNGTLRVPGQQTSCVSLLLSQELLQGPR